VRWGIVIRDRKILLGLRNYTADKWKDISVWAMPGGRCDNGETLATTLRREIAEEVGINDLEIRDFVGERPGAKDGDTIVMFYCTTNQDAKLMEPEKFSEWRWVPISEYLAGDVFSQMNPTAHDVISNYIRHHGI
jgi:8-oxo-dGTP pyrophosphatase MutT (NUDIX family)